MLASHRPIEPGGECGIASWREADERIEAGRVKVDGEIAMLLPDPGTMQAQDESMNGR